MMATTVNDDSLKGSLAISAMLHALFFLFLYIGLPVMFTPLPQHHVPVPFEIVEIADITNTHIKDETKPEPPQPPPPPKPEVKPAPPPQVQALPPEPPKPIAEAIKPAVKPTPPAPPKPKADEFSKLLKNLEAKKPEIAKSDSKADSKAQTTQQVNSQAPSLSDRLTISEEDAVRRQIEQCWNPPIGARNAQTMVVQVTGDITPDGIVQNAEVVDKSRAATDSFYRAMAESAIRALYNPSCAPLKLPADKYEEWKHFVFTFDPRDLL